jgi:DNA-binding transcriptional regulator YdaS (Cro superfamily)
MNTSATPQEALKRACKAHGNQTTLAQALGRKKAAVSRWMLEGVPVAVCPDIEALTGVRCEELRPDVNWAVLRNPASTEDESDFSQSIDPSCKG